MVGKFSWNKVLAHVGIRVGPGVCGVVGVLTPVCDGLKLALCGVVWVVGLEIWVSVFCGVVMFWVVGLVWCVVPFGVIVVCDVVFSFWSLVGLGLCRHSCFGVGGLMYFVFIADLVVYAELMRCSPWQRLSVVDTCRMRCLWVLQWN